jgi:pimeloyl-ACP methyl ester carboxylesterase
VHYRISGTGFPLVLLHGTGASLHTWEGWTNALQNEYQIISLDLPAFGLTGPSKNRDYSIDAYVEFVHQFLNKIGVDSFALAGNSLGGGIAWNYAAKYTDKMKGLILIDPTGFKQTKKLPLALSIAKNKIVAPMLKIFSPKFLFNKSLKEVYYNDDLLTQATIDRYYQLFLREGNRQAYIDRAQTPTTYDTDLLNEISIPTLIMWGANDEWITSKDATKFKKRIKSAKVIIYSKMGHVPMEEAPKNTAKDALDFLKEKI